jgi:hypothetical protein
MPFKYADGKKGMFDDCVSYYTTQTSKRTGKKYTKDDARRVCATIMRSQENNAKKDEPKKDDDMPKKDEKTTPKEPKGEKKEKTKGKFTLSIHQLGNEKHFDIFLEKDGFCEDWAFTPFKTGEKMMLKMGIRCQKRTNTPLEMLSFNGTIPIGKPGATTNFPGIVTKLEDGTYELLKDEGKVRIIKFNGKKLTGMFEMLYDDADLVENYKYRYIFNHVNSKDMMISNMSKQILELSKTEQSTEKLSNKDEVKIVGNLTGMPAVPLTIKGVAIKEGLWNGLYYPYEEIKNRINTLVGKPVFLDHNKSVRDMVGKVKSVTNDDVNRQALFEVDVFDELTARKIMEHLVDSVSVGVVVDRVKEGNTLIARNHDYGELSFVIIPACDSAKITEIVNPNSVN